MTAARLVMLVLAVVTGWAAVTAASGTGHARDVQLAGPPVVDVTAAPAPLRTEDVAATVAEEDASLIRQARRRSSSRSQDRLDPRFASCRAARAAGFGPYRSGRDTEYRWYPDADRDGVVCA